MGVDDRVRRALREIPPADPTGAYERIVEKKVRRRVTATVGRVALSISVLAGTAIGLVGLSKAFQQAPGRIAGGPTGVIAFTNFDSSRAIDQISAGWGIYTMDSDGSNLRFLPTNVDETLYPSFAPDGRRIAFAGFRNDPEERGLFVRQADGSVRDIFPIEDKRHQIDAVAWSPDGTRIAFTYTERTPTEPQPDAGAREFARASTIWTISPDGSDLTQVTTVGREDDPSWSPDGSRIAFSRYEPITGPQSRSDLYTIAVDGSDEQRVTDDMNAADPAWSPDGGTIAYVGSGTGGGSADVYAVDADGSDVRRLTDDPGNEYNPTWSPDGSRIAYAERALDPGAGGPTCFVSVMGADGFGRRRLFGVPDTEGCPGQLGLTWAARPVTPPSEAVGPAEPKTGIESPLDGEDIGLARNLCRPETLDNIDFLGQGIEGTAWTGVSVNAGGECPKRAGGPEDDVILAVDADGDGRADDAYHALDACYVCRPYAATDLDSDGDDEFLVEIADGGLPRFEVFDINILEGTVSVAPVRIAFPGDPAAGFEGGDPLVLDPGGDAGYASVVTCEGWPEHTVLISASSYGPVDDPTAPETVHVVKFSIRRGAAFVVDSTTYRQPAGDGLPYPETKRACGVRWFPLN